MPSDSVSIPVGDGPAVYYINAEGATWRLDVSIPVGSLNTRESAIACALLTHAHASVTAQCKPVQPLMPPGFPF